MPTVLLYGTHRQLPRVGNAAGDGKVMVVAELLNMVLAVDVGVVT